MSANTALKIQELCDSIAAFLTESSWDLKSCALISPTFASAAQRHLFHDIIFNRGCLDLDNPALLGNYDEAGACGRFCAVLRTSPHLRFLVRRVRAGFEQQVLSALCAMEFPNLRDVVLHRKGGGSANETVIKLAAQLISTPSLHRVGLLYLIFPNVASFTTLFQNCADTMDSVFFYHPSFDHIDASPPCRLVKIRILRIGVIWDPSLEYVLGPLSPFDFSGLAQFDYLRVTPITIRLIENARLSLTRLTIDAQSALNAEYTDNPQTMLLARLPALTHLTLVSTGKALVDVETLLAGLRSGQRIAHVTFVLNKVGQLDVEVARRVGAACASTAESVSVRVRRVASGMDGTHVARAVRTAFAELDVRGALKIAVL
ncbi:hypothetical protein B0H11DRAFT_2069167 [Mycena galericulata]|nr:hypothetical protein B0H11DRAFT_2069167 [Mycena galericulata]